MRDLYALYASTPDGVSVLTEPVTIAEAMGLVDEHLAPRGWHHRYKPLTPLDQAIGMFTAGSRKGRPIEEADFFVALRRAIITDPERDGLDDYFVRGMLAHVDPHRPMQLYAGDEEHLLGECDCPRRDGVCAELELAERICVACTAIIDSGSEFGPWFACKVTWPCSVVAAAAGQYGVELGPVHA
jgi:hypothetical protein